LLVVKAAERVTPDQARALSTIAVHLQQAEHNLESFFRLSGHLDSLLEAACQNTFIAQALSPLRNQCQRLWYMHRRRLDMPRVLQLHASLASAVARREASSAIRAMDEITLLTHDMIERMEATDGY
jgi:DNA-binding GntR family transcriptional regulator